MCSERAYAPILGPGEGAAAEVINPGGGGPVVLVCEHASNTIPAALDGLGLDAAARISHAAWDIGAGVVAGGLSAALDAPLVVSRISRLVYDCNRPPSSEAAIAMQSEIYAIPGNRGLNPAARAARVAEVYEPFRRLLADTLDAHAARRPALVTVHSFTPVYHGVARAVELGLLHDADDRLARAMLAAAPPGRDARLNAPYDASDGVTHTLAEHAIPRGLLNVMIELRNDLLSDSAGIAGATDELTHMIERGLAACNHADDSSAAGEGCS